MKTVIFFVALIAAVGYFGYQYLQEEDCVKSPYTNECVNTSTGYEANDYGGGGGDTGGGAGANGARISGADNSGGGGIEIQVP